MPGGGRGRPRRAQLNASTGRHLGRRTIVRIMGKTARRDQAQLLAGHRAAPLVLAPSRPAARGRALTERARARP